MKHAQPTDLKFRVGHRTVTLWLHPLQPDSKTVHTDLRWTPDAPAVMTEAEEALFEAGIAQIKQTIAKGSRVKSSVVERRSGPPVFVVK